MLKLERKYLQNKFCGLVFWTRLILAMVGHFSYTENKHFNASNLAVYVIVDFVNLLLSWNIFFGNQTIQSLARSKKNFQPSISLTVWASFSDQSTWQSGQTRPRLSKHSRQKIPLQSSVSHWISWSLLEPPAWYSWKKVENLLTSFWNYRTTSRQNPHPAKTFSSKFCTFRSCFWASGSRWTICSLLDRTEASWRNFSFFLRCGGATKRRVLEIARDRWTTWWLVAFWTRTAQISLEATKTGLSREFSGTSESLGDAVVASKALSQLRSISSTAWKCSQFLCTCLPQVQSPELRFPQLLSNFWYVACWRHENVRPPAARTASSPRLEFR